MRGDFILLKRETAAGQDRKRKDRAGGRSSGRGRTRQARLRRGGPGQLDPAPVHESFDQNVDHAQREAGTTGKITLGDGVRFEGGTLQGFEEEEFCFREIFFTHGFFEGRRAETGERYSVDQGFHPVEERNESVMGGGESDKRGRYFVLDCEYPVRIEASGIQIPEHMAKGTKIVKEHQGRPVKKSRPDTRDGEGHSVKEILVPGGRINPVFKKTCNPVTVILHKAINAMNGISEGSVVEFIGSTGGDALCCTFIFIKTQGEILDIGIQFGFESFQVSSGAFHGQCLLIENGWKGNRDRRGRSTGQGLRIQCWRG